MFLIPGSFAPVLNHERSKICSFGAGPTLPAWASEPSRARFSLEARVHAFSPVDYPAILRDLRCYLAAAHGSCGSNSVSVAWLEGPPSLRDEAMRSFESAAFHGELRTGGQQGGFVGIFDGHPPPPEPSWRAPEDFRVLAIVPVYNEEDVIAQTLRDLLAQGLQPYVVDNWSTDRTVQRMQEFQGNGLHGIEHFPRGGPGQTYDLEALLQRVEEIAVEQQSWASWVTLHDADERRRSPWPGVRLREALWHVDRCGYNCVDHVTMNFWPVDESFDGDGLTDLEQHFRYFEFSEHPGHFHQRRTWKQAGGQGRVQLAATAGHDVEFEGRRVYPYKFLLKHYPIRSQAHGERKVLRDRASRWNAEERARGWHKQYDEIEDLRFIRDPATLTLFDEATFLNDYVVQRLTGVGIFAEAPSWATPPLWRRDGG